MLDVEQWAQIRRMKHVEGLSQREIHRRTGAHRDTIRRALAQPKPPSYGPRPKRPSKLDPFVAEHRGAARGRARLSGVRIREELEKAGYEGSKTILDDLLRELRPRYSAAAAQLPAHPLPPRRAGAVRPLRAASPRSRSAMARAAAGTSSPVSCRYSRAFAGALVFSKEFADIAWGMSALPARPRRAAGQARLGSRGRDRAAGAPDAGVPRLLRRALARLGDPRRRATARPRARSSAATASCTATSRPAGASLTHLDFQDQLDRWCERINARVHRSTRAVVAERLHEERERMRALPRAMPDTDRRFVMRVPRAALPAL